MFFFVALDSTKWARMADCESTYDKDEKRER